MTAELNVLRGFEPEYVRGVPTNETAQRMFDELAYQRATQVYLWGLAAVGMHQYRKANGEAMGGGSDRHKIGYLGGLLKSNIEHVTGNPDSCYIECFIDTHDGPVMVEAPPELPGLLDDMWQKPVVDIIAPISPSGKYLIVPPGWGGKAPADCVVARPATYVTWFALRGGVEQTATGPDTSTAVELMRTKLIFYPFTTDGAEPDASPMEYYNVSDLAINRVMPEGLEFFYALAEVVSSEAPEQTDSFAMGLMRSIGIEPGGTFQPDQRMRAILTKAASTGQAMARTIAYHGNEEERWHWPDRRYGEAFMGGSAAFLADGHVNHDPRIAFFYLACGTSALMASKTPGVGQAYPWVARDADGNAFDGAQTYKMHIPADIPAALYWSVTAYDTGTRSQIHNGEPFSRISMFTGPAGNPDGTFDLYFGPDVPAGEEANWIRTVPNQGWFILFRLYGPQQAYFDLSWKPDDIVLIRP